MIWTVMGFLALTVWLVLVFARHGFWLTRERDTRALPAAPAVWPEVVAVVPARDEADVIARSIGSLAAQDYPGPFRIILMDDGSSDGTGDIARGLGQVDLSHPQVRHPDESQDPLCAPWPSERRMDADFHQHDEEGDNKGEEHAESGARPHSVTVIPGLPLAPGWTGKLWAVSQGVDHAGPSPRYLWLTDADIEHAPDTLRMLVTRAEAGTLSLASLMAKLRCDSVAERMLIPAFVFFFQMLYPFGLVNRPTGLGGAAGGCMVVRRDSLEAAGGIAAIRDALIDDCTLGALLKRQGPVWLGLTDRSRSIRPYEGFGTVAAMISRSAYAQLRYSPVLLAGTVAGLALVYAAPPLLAIFGAGAARISGIIAWALMAIAFQPMLRFYRRSPLWGVALPAIAAFYAGCTLLSGWQHARGRGGMWKGRAQAAAGK